MDQHPVRLVVEDDLRRSRLTVFFRVLLAIPHYIWITLWTIAAIVAAVVSWFATLIVGRSPARLHRFLCAYVRYTVHLNAYMHLVANPYPGFSGTPGEYPVDVVLPAEPLPQVRWKTLIRIVLGIPAYAIAAVLGPVTGPTLSFALFGPNSRTNFGVNGSGGLLASVCAFQGWFVSIVLGRMPRGLRDAGAYGVGYGAQVLSYLLLVTDRYPNADPTQMLASVVEHPAPHPVRVVGDPHDLRRSRLTVFFRLPLTIPHFVWLYLWGIVVELVAILNWFATLALGRPPRPFHRFLSRYLRYQLHVGAYFFLAANPFPGFVGAPGSYPLDAVLPGEPQRQHRLKTLFRLVLAIPALFVGLALEYALFVAAAFTWFVALARGEAPWGLRNLMAYALRYLAQLYAYLYLITDRYPNASPLEGAEVSPQQEPELSPAA